MPTLMLPAVGCIYKFTFRDGYTYHNGIYKVAKIMTYDEYASDDHDIFDDFFLPNNKTQDDLTNSLAEITSSKILKLVDPDEISESDTEYYVPLNFLEETPDFNVDKYYKFGFAVDAGITKDPSLLAFIKDNIIQACEAVQGVTPKISTITLHELWMTESEYQNLLKQRDESKLKIINYYSENLRLQKQLSMTNTKLKEYEKLIANLQQQVDSYKKSNEG